VSVVDTLVLVVLAIGLALGLVRGFVTQFTGVAGLFGGIYLAGHWYTPLRHAAIDPFVDTQHNGEIAFVFIVVMIVLSAAVVGWVVKKAFEKLDLGAYDRLMGGCFGILKAGLICAAILLAVVYFAPNGGRLEQSISSSKAGPMLWGAMDSVAGALPNPYRAGAQDFLHKNALPPPSRSETRAAE